MERDRRPRRRHDLASNRQDPVHLSDALFEVVALNRRHRRQQQVADGVAAEAALALAREAVLEEFAHQRLGVRQRDDAVANVSYRRDSQLLAKPARRAAIVRDRNHGRDVAGVLLDPAQQRGQARSAADDRDLGPRDRKRFW